MSTMFDKLGKILSQCLESGEIPSTKKDSSLKDSSKKNIPLELKTEFEFFGYNRIINETNQIAQVPDFSAIRAKYASMIKQIHPDTAAMDSIDSDTVALQLEKTTASFNKIKKWYQENQ